MHADPQTPREEIRAAGVPSMRAAVVQTAVATAWCAGILFATFTISVGDSDLRSLVAPHTVEPFRVQPQALPRSAGAGGEGTAPGAVGARRLVVPGGAGTGERATSGATSARRTGQIMTTISLSQATGPAPVAPTGPLSGTGGAGTMLTLDGGADGTEARIVVRDGRPGSVGTMTIRVRNTGAAAAPLALTRGTITDRPGPFGGLLSSRLLLRVADAGGGPIRPASTLASTGTIPLGAVPPRRSRSWTVALVFPDGGVPASARSGDNAFQGSAVDARLEVVERPAR